MEKWILSSSAQWSPKIDLWNQNKNAKLSEGDGLKLAKKKHICGHLVRFIYVFSAFSGFRWLQLFELIFLNSFSNHDLFEWFEHFMEKSLIYSTMWDFGHISGESEPLKIIWISYGTLRWFGLMTIQHYLLLIGLDVNGYNNLHESRFAIYLN